MEYYESVLVPRKKPEEGDKDKPVVASSEKHLGDGAKRHHFFKCDRLNPKCNGSRHYTFTSKSDRSAINSQEVIDKNLKELKAAKKRGGNPNVSGSQFIGDTEIISRPTFDEVVIPSFEDV